MSSCAKYGAIIEYYWHPIQIYFTIVNKTRIPIRSFSPDFPLYINRVKTTVNVYAFDIESDILLGHDFVNNICQ
jgi:hypothetical protein